MLRLAMQSYCPPWEVRTGVKLSVLVDTSPSPDIADSDVVETVTLDTPLIVPLGHTHSMDGVVLSACRKVT